ncbi:MAG: TonB family protein [Pseudomonadota bacterium]|nr:energy transducer TonB [Alteromonadaceae bacterium]MDY6927877.1 TonB family protein [Pseudomonadota bacterium]RPH16424.1 MAG: TonB family protein [Alteromonadaceae bacterium TMED7]|tara:strand:+ start:5327 stop:5965 length:639 start_codon:yes stop_codon:yes gene_type:complete
MQLTVNPIFSTSHYVRPLSHLLLAALVTFGLFVMMAKLIEQHGEAPKVEDPVVIDDFLLHVEEPETITRQPVKPMEKPLEQPPSLPEPVESDPGPTELSVNVNPIIPGNQIAINTHFGQQSDTSARPIVRVNPSYPSEAARQGIEGWVQLTFDLTPQGTVTNITVVDAEPLRIFNREAKRALAKWRYQPQVEKGVPVGQTGLQVVLTFKLEQ